MSPEAILILALIAAAIGITIYKLRKHDGPSY